MLVTCYFCLTPAGTLRCTHVQTLRHILTWLHAHTCTQSQAYPNVCAPLLMQAEMTQHTCTQANETHIHMCPSPVSTGRSLPVVCVPEGGLEAEQSNSCFWCSAAFCFSSLWGLGVRSRHAFYSVPENSWTSSRPSQPFTEMPLEMVPSENSTRPLAFSFLQVDEQMQFNLRPVNFTIRYKQVKYGALLCTLPPALRPWE